MPLVFRSTVWSPRWLLWIYGRSCTRQHQTRSCSLTSARLCNKEVDQTQRFGRVQWNNNKDREQLATQQCYKNGRDLADFHPSVIARQFFTNILIQRLHHLHQFKLFIVMSHYVINVIIGCKIAHLAQMVLFMQYIISNSSLVNSICQNLQNPLHCTRWSPSTRWSGLLEERWWSILDSLSVWRLLHLVTKKRTLLDVTRVLVSLDYPSLERLSSLSW